MDLKLKREPIAINEVAFDGTLEQGIELDYLLPDYCPGIFKVLRCTVTPQITSERITGEKLMLEGLASIQILYVSEEQYRVCSIQQKQPFSKTVALKDVPENGRIVSRVKCDYVNCRAVGQRRLDLRGSLSIHVTVHTVRSLPLLRSAEGMGVQVAVRQTTALDRKQFASKEFTIREELELSYGKPDIQSVLFTSAKAVLLEYKVIANRLVLKGELLLHLLYAADDEAQTPTIMEHSIPMSQVIDVPGVSEEYRCIVDFDVSAVELTTRQDGDGNTRCYQAVFTIRARCEACKNSELRLIEDAYSTRFETELHQVPLKLERLECLLQERAMLKQTLPLPQSALSDVYDLVASFTEEACRFEGSTLLITGSLQVAMLGKDSDGMPVLLEKALPGEVRVDTKVMGENRIFTPHITVTALSYSLLSGGELEIRAELSVCGYLLQSEECAPAEELSINESCPRSRSDVAALRLVYANPGDRVWNLAKRYCTTAEAIMAENQLESDSLSARMLLLIPTTD